MSVKLTKGDICMLFLNDIILICVLSALAGAGAVFAFFFFRCKGKKSTDDMKPSDKKNVIIGLRDNAEVFADLLEPLFILASGRTERKDEILDSWYEKVSSLEDNKEFKESFVKKFGEIASFKGKKSKYVKCAGRILKYCYKAGIERDDDTVVTADETTAEKYDIIGAGSIEAGKVYDVFVPYWELEIETKDENGAEIETETVLCKGAIR